MSANALIECVPNFSEGRNPEAIQQITSTIEEVEGVRLLDVDPGKATHRTVVTFVGHPEKVVEAAFRAIKKASEVIDMSIHKGEHPRMGATDVCPLIPIANISMEETVKYAHKLAKRVVDELDIPIYMYEEAATSAKRKNLAYIRSGEYEAIANKMTKSEWKPDYGKAIFNEKSGATVIGARDFLVAYNVNLNTASVRKANSVAFDVRERGRVKRKGHPIIGTIVKKKNGEAARVPGMCKSVKGIGWFIEEYGIAQISMNLTNINICSLHEAFEACCKSATKRGLRVTGSELIGLVPKKVMIDAGKHFLAKQGLSQGASEEHIIHIAIKSMGLDELSPFDPKKKIIEYLLEDENDAPLLQMDLRAFADMTASDSPAPGGGSIAAYVGSLGASLGTMVANLSVTKRGWDDKIEYFSEWAEQGQNLKDALLKLVDEDTKAFNQIITSIRLPKGTKEEKSFRFQAIRNATKNAINIPLKVMQTSIDCYPLLKQMAKEGNPNSVSDAGVGALCVHTAVYGAFLNVKINCADFKDKEFVEKSLKRATRHLTKSEKEQKLILKITDKVIS